MILVELHVYRGKWDESMLAGRCIVQQRLLLIGHSYSVLTLKNSMLTTYSLVSYLSKANSQLLNSYCNTT